MPIVEPEVLMDGNHTIERCEEVTQLTQHVVFNALYSQRIVLEQMLLKPSMIVSGKDCPQQAGLQQVAQATVRCLRRNVPAAVPGIVFLSGGQSDIVATQNLNAINQLGPHPWQVTFSYGRALQDASLKAWGGDASKTKAGQDALLHRAACNGAAHNGKYSETVEASSGRESSIAAASVSQD